jgi:hypothetical protein
MHCIQAEALHSPEVDAIYGRCRSSPAAGTAKTFQKYVDPIFVTYVTAQLETTRLVGRYCLGCVPSLKSTTRQKRNKCASWRLVPTTRTSYVLTSTKRSYLAVCHNVSSFNLCKCYSIRFWKASLPMSCIDCHWQVYYRIQYGQLVMPTQMWYNHLKS